MYVIYRSTFRGAKEFFSGKTHIVNGKRMAIMTLQGHVKIFKSIKGVSNATLKLQKRCPDQVPFYATTVEEYINEKWGLN